MLRRKSQNCLDLFARDTGKIRQKYLHRIPRAQMIEQAFHGNTGSSKHRRTAEACRVLLNDTPPPALAIVLSRVDRHSSSISQNMATQQLARPSREWKKFLQELQQFIARQINIFQNLAQQSGAKDFARMNWNDRASSVFVTENMVTTLGTNDFKASTAEGAEEIFGGETRQFRHPLHRDALNANEFTTTTRPLLDFEAEINRLADALHQPVQRFGLGMAPVKFRHARHVITGVIPLDDDVKIATPFALRLFRLSHVIILLLAALPDHFLHGSSFRFSQTARSLSQSFEPFRARGLVQLMDVVQDLDLTGSRKTPQLGDY